MTTNTEVKAQYEAQCKRASPHDELIAELLDSRVPKTEREHAAAREIKKNQDRIAAARLALVKYGLHENSCSVFCFDDEGRHCACNCGYEAANAAAEGLKEGRK